MKTIGGRLDAILAGAGVIALTAGGVAFDRLYLRGQAARSPSPAFTTLIRGTLWDTLVSEGQTIGRLDAPITIVEFGDYQCPACRSFQLGPIAGALRSFPASVKVIYRHFPLPFHPAAYDAARAAVCAGRQSWFEQLHIALFEQQALLGDKRFGEIAGIAGVPDLAAFELCLADTAGAGAVERDLLTARGMGVSSTPTIAVNGRLLPVPPDSIELDYHVRGLLRRRAAREDGS